MDAYSTRTVQVREKERELARAWERKHGRAPTSRELLHIANAATLQSRKGKERGRDRLGRARAAVGRHPRRRPGRDRARGVGRARPRRTRARASRRPGAVRTAHARGPGTCIGQGPGPGVGPAPGLDPARPAQAAGPGPACGNPADEPGRSPGTAVRPGRGGAVRQVRRGGVPGGAGVAAAARVAAPRAGRPQRLHAAWRRAVRHHRAADAWRSGWSRTRRRKVRRAFPASWPRGASAPISRSSRGTGRPRARAARARRAARAAPGPGRRRLARAHLAPHRRGDHRPGGHRQDPRPGHHRPGRGTARSSAPRHPRTPPTVSGQPGYGKRSIPPGCSPPSSAARSRPARSSWPTKAP